MSAATMLTESCTVLRRSTSSTDDHGHPVWEWDNVATERCRWWEDSQKVLSVGQEAAVTANTIILSPASVVRVTDRIYLHTKTYEVQGLKDWRAQVGNVAFKEATCLAVN